MQAIDAALLDTLAACGDVNRNVLAIVEPASVARASAPPTSSRGRSRSTCCRTRRAYREIWLDGEKIAGGEDGGRRADLRHDLSAAQVQDRRRGAAATTTSTCSRRTSASSRSSTSTASIEGWNVTVGGGMGMTHGEPETYPRTADVLGFCRPDDALAVAEAVVTVQRDWGDRTNRKHARLKYTIEDRGLDAFRAEVERRIGKRARRPRAVRVRHRTATATAGSRATTGARISRCSSRTAASRDIAGGPALLTGLRRIAEVHDGEFRLHREPERHHRQRRAGEARRDRRAGRRARPDQQRRRALRRNAHGLRRAADLRPRAGRERALPADAGDRARGAARRARARATTRSPSA